MVVIEQDSKDQAAGGTSLEFVLEKWEELQPSGFVLPESIASGLIPKLALQLLGTKNCFSPWDQRCAEVHMTMFTKSHLGQFHFLYVWRAFCKARDLQVEEGRELDSEIAAMQGNCLSLQLEALRDAVLDLVDESLNGKHANDPYDRLTIDKAIVAEALRGAANAGTAPEVWREAEQQLSSQEATVLTLEEIVELMLSCLDGSAERQLPVKAARGEMPVFLHIYDVSRDEGIHKLNKVLAHKFAPLKFGGIFHAGIEVGGLEWSFGAPVNESRAGIECVLPKTHKQHRYRQTLQLRPTSLKHEDIARILSQLLDDYPGDSYDLLHRNCCHFVNDFAKRIGAGKVPQWVRRLARVGALVDSALQKVSKRNLLSRLRLPGRGKKSMHESLGLPVQI
eukprot:TRINITY_DN41732_c0_g1_i1.p1 TRINITY_DN41732_c0_g1~~TRINITY_DN41732_c0_g1_i1.p1  ORF type:complete len:394 (-),score=73.51 TRINITY_DN41732_c0_g1_i1:82-1263(-)